MNSAAAKQFLIAKIIEQAGLEHVPLSEIERKMLAFTEVHPAQPDIYEINAEFERNYDSDEYEAKIAKLLTSARGRDSDLSSSREQEWKDAIEALKKEDHYILVMVAQAFGGDRHRVRDSLIYILIGIGIVVFMVLKALWKARH